MRDARIDIEQIKEDWLVGNAVVAFVGALLMAQAWEPSGVKNVIPILNVTVPSFPQAAILGIVALLAISSFVLVLASTVPPLRSWAIRQVSPFSQLLEWLIWFAFLMSLLAALSEIPRDESWAEALALSGLALWLFLGVRMVLKPLNPPAMHLSRSLFRLVAKAGNRFVASQPRPDDADDTDRE